LSNLHQSTFWDKLPDLKRPKPASVPRFEYDPELAENEAIAILERARAESAAIIADANEAAASRLALVEIEAEEIREQARKTGEREGFERAKAEVQNELSVAWNQTVDSLRADVQMLIDSIAEQRQALWEQTELEVVGFAIEMAKKVVKVEIQQNPKIIGEMIRHALRRVADKDNIRIRVCPEELQEIRSDRKDLLLVLDGARQLEIVDDRRISRGGCVIETTAGTVDARIETQFEQIADKVGALPFGGEESE